MDCNFENGLCKYINDAANWKLNWEIVSLDTFGFVDGNQMEKKGLCMIADGSDSEDASVKVTARLWSGVMSKKANVGCVSFVYRMVNEGDHRLTLMRREIGLVDWIGWIVLDAIRVRLIGHINMQIYGVAGTSGFYRFCSKTGSGF